MKTYFLTPSIIILTISVLLFSCKKPKENNVNEINFQKKYMSSSIHSLSNQPTVSNGILVFQSKESLNQYLRNLHELPNQLPDSIEIDSLLDDIENSFGNVSYRKDYLNTYDISEENPTPRFFDYAFQSVLNSRLEVVVESKYYNYHFSKYVVVCESPTTEKINTIREVLRHCDDPMILSREVEKAGQFDVYVLFEENDIDLLQKKSIETDNQSIQFHFVDDYGQGCTSTTLKLNKFRAKANGFITSSLAGEYEVNWGDGSPVSQWTVNSIIGNWGPATDIAHTYASPGTYILTFKWNSNAFGGGIVTAHFTVNILQGCGSPGYKSKSVWLYPNNGDNAIETTIWSDKTSISKAIGASTYFYKKKNGKYKKEKASNIEAIVEGNISTNCTNPLWKSNTESKSNNNDARAKVGNLGDYTYSQINSQHMVVYNGVTYLHNNLLKTCP